MPVFENGSLNDVDIEHSHWRVPPLRRTPTPIAGSTRSRQMIESNIEYHVSLCGAAFSLRSNLERGKRLVGWQAEKGRLLEPQL